VDEDRLRARLFSRYNITREIGRGGMATVYLARDVKQDRDVAIKVLHQELSASLSSERFRREIQIAGHLAHPNILPVHDSGEVDDLLYLVMPFVAGESLRGRLDREGQLVLEDAIQMATEVASALDFAHREGVVHRDIKPENILLGDGHAYVADFGIARAINTAGEDRITKTGITVGTPTYMSPEQAAAQSGLDGRSDIYSLGCVLYEMLAGTPPFTGPTTQVIVARHTLEDPPSLVVARRGVPEHVEATIMRALAKSPADRFRTAAEFCDALAGRRSVTMPRISRSTIPSIGTRPPNRRRQITAGLLIAGAAMGIAGWVWTRPKGERVVGGSVLDSRHIAVMYFEDGTGDKLRYLADGLTEALIDRLRDVRGLSVVSANGTRQFSSQTSPDSVARALSVGTVVRGSIEPTRGDSVRVTVRLVEGLSGTDFKRATFAGSIRDPLRLRDDLAERAATFLRERLGQEIRLQSSRSETKNASAWAIVRQAERLKNDAEEAAEEDSVAKSTAAFNRADSLLAGAEALDPRWPEPIILRGTIAYRRARLAENRIRASEWIPQGLGHAERALALDPRNADALELRGSLRYWRWLLSLEPDPAKAAALLSDAEADLRQAVSISPTNASAWSTLSHLHLQKPDFTESKLAAQRAYEEDAYLTAAPEIVWRLYHTSYDLEDFPAAAQWCEVGRKRFRENSRFVECQLWLMTATDAKPDIQFAWRLRDSLHHMTPADQWPSRGREMQLAVAAVIARAATNGADRPLADSARRVAKRAHALRKDDPDGELLGPESFVHMILNDKAEAIRLLKEYFAINPSHRAGFARTNHWWWRPLRDDPAFAELVGFSHGAR
jgi:serine/threonine-protein kinase